MLESMYFYGLIASVAIATEREARSMKRTIRIAVPLVAGVFSAALVANAQDISDSAYQQMRELLLEKESRTAVQHKLSASLVYAANAARGVTTAGVNDLGNPATTLHMGPQGALVKTQATVSAELLNTIAKSADA